MLLSWGNTGLKFYGTNNFPFLSFLDRSPGGYCMSRQRYKNILNVKAIWGSIRTLPHMFFFAISEGRCIAWSGSMCGPWGGRRSYSVLHQPCDLVRVFINCVVIGPPVQWMWQCLLQLRLEFHEIRDIDTLLSCYVNVLLLTLPQQIKQNHHYSSPDNTNLRSH